MARIKAYAALLIIFVIWISMIVRQLPLMLAAYFHDLKKPPLTTEDGRLYNILLGQDIYINTLLSGYYRTMISSELGNQARHRQSGKEAAAVVDWLFEVAGDDPNHCEQAIEAEDKHLFNPRVAAWSFILWLAGGLLKAALIIAVYSAIAEVL